MMATNLGTMTATAPRCRRTSIREQLGKKRASLAPHEFSFVSEMLEIGEDEHLESIEQVLMDEDLFFSGSTEEEEDQFETSMEESHVENDDEDEDKDLHDEATGSELERLSPVPPASGGSTRRASRMEQRRSCGTSAELWRRASLKMRTANLMTGQASGASSLNNKKKTRTSTFLPICEDDALELGQEERDLRFAPDDDDDVLDGAKKEEEEEKSEKESSKLDFLTKRASQNLYRGEGFEIGAEELFAMYSVPQYDPWDEETDREGQAFDFHILGTSHYDSNAMPHVLSPPIMHALQSSLPVSKRGESFWLKYSLVRDGDSTTKFLRTLRGSPYTLIAMETVDGEVFGAFTSAAWTIQPSFFGGGEAFVWRMKHSRLEIADSVMEQAQQETDLEVFPYSYENPFVQVCQTDKVAVGGGTPSLPREVQGGTLVPPAAFGAALAFEGSSMMEATSAPCLTFRSPSLSKLHHDGSRFELINLEAWSFTPCITLAEAQRMECHNLFLKRNSQ